MRAQAEPHQLAVARVHRAGGQAQVGLDAGEPRRLHLDIEADAADPADLAVMLLARRMIGDGRRVVADGPRAVTLPVPAVEQQAEVGERVGVLGNPPRGGVTGLGEHEAGAPGGARDVREEVARGQVSRHGPHSTATRRVVNMLGGSQTGYVGTRRADPRPGKVTGMTVLERIREYMRAHAIAHREIAHPPAARTEEYSQALGSRYEQQAKCLLVRLSQAGGAEEHVIAAIPASKKLDLGAVARLTGARRAKLAAREQLTTVTGCEFGALPPIGSIFSLRLLVDRDLLTESEIYLNAGAVDHSMVIAPADLVRVGPLLL
jgi:Ala-tRNA(Pro) deacylase